jgi:MFS transporter, ACS family, DAL5 transporter family protein
VGGHAGWRWLFLIEALFTFVVGFITFFNMPSCPTATKTWFRPKGWYTDREEIIMTNRILRDDPGSEQYFPSLRFYPSEVDVCLENAEGLMHNRQAISLSMLWESICDFDLWPLYAVSICIIRAGGEGTNQLYVTDRLD